MINHLHNLGAKERTTSLNLVLLGHKGRDAGDAAAQDERVHIVSALVGVHGLQVGHVADDVVLVRDTVATQHVSAGAGDVETLAAGIALHEGDHLRHVLLLLDELAHTQHGLVAQRKLGDGVRELLLDELVGRQGRAELLSVQSVLASNADASLRGTQGTPGNTETRVVQAAEGSAEALGLGEHVLLGHVNLVHEDHTGHGSTQTHLALDLRSGQALHALLQDETTDVTGIVLGPDDEHVRHGGVGDPVLGTGHLEAAIGLGAGTRLHAGGVTAVVGLGETEAANLDSLGQVRKVLLLLLLGAVVVNRPHDQRRLYTHGGSVATVDSLDSVGDQTIRVVTHTCASIALESRAQKAHFTHFSHDVNIKMFLSVGLKNSGLKLTVAEIASAIEDGTLILRQLIAQKERIVPDKFLLTERSNRYRRQTSGNFILENVGKHD
mmetsp:Transcript_42159/g.73303  ORF Transcript_42159/g.73303 Transcript_42159/m.73303 type:complete len:438 (+) Transcript_42159:41-1354(+)